MNVADKTILITGANRGIGRALVGEALKRGAKRVYAGTRQATTHDDRRVTSLTLDVTNAADVARAAETVASLDILVNNAGIAVFDDFGGREAIDRHLEVNLFGPFFVTQALLPQLIQSKGAVVNIVSLAAFAAIPVLPAYSISKAAAFAFSQSLRALLAGRGVRVHAVLPGPVDTDMNRELDIPKTAPDVAAGAIFDGVERDEEDIFPDVMSEALAPGWRDGSLKAFERQIAGMVPAQS